MTCKAYPVSLLYVEDDEATRRLVRKIISHSFPHLVVHSAKNGEEGVALFREVGSDIVVSDIMMAGISGIQMAQEIKILSPQTHCIFTTAITGDPECLALAGELSTARLFFKPTDCSELIRAIAECLALVRENKLSAG